MNLPKASPRSMEKFSLLMKHVQSSSPRVRILLLSSLILFFFGFAYLYLFSDLFNNNNNNEWNSNLNYSSIFPNLSAKTSPENRIAICLCGGLRQFELTAPTIQKHILSTYANAADVYIVSPFDDTSGKLWVLSDSQVVALHFVKQFDFPADDIMNAVLLDQWKTGRQGLLRYAELVERCSHLIRMHEFKHGFEYKWILRTRPDTLWRENAPPLDSLSAEELYIPYVITPMDVVKQRLQLRRSPYKGLLDCVSRIFREEGFKAFYASYRTTVVMNIPFTAVHFASYEAVKTSLLDTGDGPDSEENFLTHLVAGGSAGALASAVTNPLDVVKTRLQCQGICGAQKFKTSSVLDALNTIVKEEGWKVLLRGIRPRVMFHTPAAAICWSSYEAGKTYLQKWNADQE